MNFQIYKSLKDIIMYSEWHLKHNSYLETKETYQFTLRIRSLKIEVVLRKKELKEDLKDLISSIKERNL